MSPRARRAYLRMNDDYELVYDVTQEWPPVWFPAFGLIFVVLGVLLWRFRDRLGNRRRSPRARKIFAGLYLGFSILWTVTVAIAVLRESYVARRALRSGTAAVVEGPVQEFHPMPYRGHDTERFRVGNVRFRYSDFSVQSGFNRSSSHGGPIREGLMVRIHYIGQPSQATILRLETRE
jgi:hypothetical protein